ncbi:hypothetical protein M0R45_034376 [Rubus argutus]|uniref:RNA-directed DNA polymerase (Reverse transcriptase) n=1 Tax=Rubus argutus TaxID=59490 RepID=A0AAW1VSY2_RUBAR
MIHISWNCQGLGKPLTHSHYVDKIRKQFGFSRGFNVDPIPTVGGRNMAGGLSLWWKPEFHVDIILHSKYFIDTVITCGNLGAKVRVTWMYGPPYYSEKSAFWESWQGQQWNDGMPWHVIGDFNELMWSFEKGPRFWGDALAAVHHVVTEDMNLNLTAPFSLDEVKAAAFQLGALKSPGPDGFPGLFYHKFWDVVNNLVYETSLDFGSGLVNLSTLNQTHIALIPKIPNPERTSHFRHISLCNNSYKILSKLIANRLKAILPALISHNQNALSLIVKSKTIFFLLMNLFTISS